MKIINSPYFYDNHSYFPINLWEIISLFSGMVTFSCLAFPNNYSRVVSRFVENTKRSKTSRSMNPRRVDLLTVLHDIVSTHQDLKS